MHYIGRFALKCQMGSVVIVSVNRLSDHGGGLCKILWFGDQKFIFQNAIDPFSQGILVTVVAIGH